MAKLGQAGPPHPRRVPGGSQGTQRPSGPPCHPPQGQGLGGATPTHPPPSAASLICYCIKSANGGRRWFREKSKSGPQHFAALAALGGAGAGREGSRVGRPQDSPSSSGKCGRVAPPPPTRGPAPVSPSIGHAALVLLPGWQEGVGFRGPSHGAPGPETLLRLSEGTAGAAKPGGPQASVTGAAVQ